MKTVKSNFVKAQINLVHCGTEAVEIVLDDEDQVYVAVCRVCKCELEHGSSPELVMTKLSEELVTK